MKKLFLIFLVLTLVLSVTACGSTSSTTEPNSTSGPDQTGEAKGKTTDYVRIGSASVGGTAFVQMNAIAQLINEKWEGVEATSQSTSGSSENIKLTLEGELDAAQAQASVIEEAINGVGSFEGKSIDPDTLRCVATIQFNSIHLMVRKDAKINAVEDLKGKRVGVGPVAGSHESAAKAFLENCGISYDDINPIYGSVSEICESIKTGGLDAVFYCTPHPSSTINDVLSTGKVKLIGISEDIAKAVDSKSTSWGSYVITAGSYSGQDEDIITIVTPTMFFVHKDMDDDWVYELTKLIYENNEFLIPFHANFRDTVPENINTGRILKMHPGAARYLTEVGVEIGEPK